jgi:hypothetical protein
MKAQRIIRHTVMTAQDRKFEDLLRQAAEFLSRRRNGVFEPPTVAAAAKRLASK